MFRLVRCLCCVGLKRPVLTQIKAEAGSAVQAHRDVNIAHWSKLAAIAIVVAWAMPDSAEADVRPLSRVMLGNLQATNAIGEGLATDDFASVEAAARELERNARELRGWDAARLGFEPSDRSQFDAYLELQEKLAGDLMRTARQKDAPALVAGFARMLGGSCLG